MKQTDQLWRRMKKERWAYFFIAPVMMHFLIFQLYPILRTLYLSFVSFNLQGDTWVGMQNYGLAIHDPIFWKSLLNTLVYAIGVVPVGLGIALFLAVLIFQLKTGAQTFFKAAFYLPGVVSAVVISMVWVWMFDPNHGILNYLLTQIGYIPIGLFCAIYVGAVILLALRKGAGNLCKAALHGVPPLALLGIAVWYWMLGPGQGAFENMISSMSLGPIPWLGEKRWALGSLMFMAIAGGGGGAIILYLAAMGGIPTTLYEAAEIDGANRFTSFWRITLPLMKPTILYLVVMQTIGCFQVFASIYLMTGGGPNYSTSTIVFRIYQTAFQFLKLGPASAMAVLLALVIICISIVQFRFLGSEVEY